MAFSTWIRNWKCSLERRWALYQSIGSKAAVRRLATRPSLEALEDRWLLSTYVVNTTADSGTGSLRDAINQANYTTSGITEIDFNIGTKGTSSGVQIISPASALPALTGNNVFINGHSENQWQGVTSTSPLIELNGASAGTGSDGLQLTGASNTVSGLLIENFYNGIEVGGDNNVLGGSVAGAGNVIADNSQGGVQVNAGTGDTIRLNSIYANGIRGTGPGISLIYNGNNNLAAPSLLTATLVGNTLSVTGTFTTATANVSYILDFYANSRTDPEGKVYLGSLTTTPTSTGTQSFTFTTTTTVTGIYPNITATLIDNSGDTSPFSNSVNSAAYVVSSTADDGSVGTLRDAINQVNAGKYDEIDFNIGTQGTSSGVQVISPGSPLPALTASGVFINGYSENIWQGVTPRPYPLIELNGASAGSNSDGLDLTGANNTVSSLAIEGFTNGIVAGGANDAIGDPVSGFGNLISGNASNGLQITASGVTVQGNFIGTTDTTGTTMTKALPNGVGIFVSANNVTIGEATNTSDDFNIIAGNRGDGVYIASGVSGVAVLGNSIGNMDTAAAGLLVIANGVGIELAGSNNTIGGTTFGFSGNIISGNTGDGVLIDSGASSNTVLGNHIGVDFVARVALSNNNGIEVAGTNNLLEGNNISANSNDGVLLDSGSSGNQVFSNAIGHKSDFQLVLPNKVGIEVAGSGNIIGSTPNGGSTISYNSVDGVLIDSTATSETMQSNYITNNGNGVEIQGFGNTIGGNSGANVNVRNTISGNTGDGVLIDGGASGNQVQGNFIGIATTFSGTIGMANSIGIEIAGNGNTIGGSASGSSNLISGNTTDGVKIDSGVSGVAVQGNFIGTDVTGTKALANGTGVEVSGSNNTIGGSSYSARNIISGNSKDGVLIDSGVSGVQVLGNTIGANAPGTAAMANGNGIEVAGSNNTLGASYAVGPNLISGNSNDGVLLDSSSSHNQVLGSYIGTNYSTTAAVANKVGIEDAGSSNTIGGSVLGARNVISGNSGDGVLLDSTATKETMQGNYIGTDTRGNTALANGTNGIEVQGSGNSIGGNSVANYFSRNFLSGNKGDGVLIDSGASGNQVLGNFIGTNIGGIAALANSIGVEIQGTGNTIGGASGSRNLISGNANDGVKIDGGGSGNVVLGNYIGVNTYDTAALGNSGNGIEVAGNSNTIGASYAVAPNEISGNSSDGVLLDSGSSGNQVLGNYIGTNHSGTAAVANKVGIEDAGSSNTLGGSVLGDKNVISGNTSDGVLLDSTATAETMQGNYIGLNVTAKSILANGSNGIEVKGNNNLIGGNSGSNYFTRNFISGNTGDGLLIANGATGNQVQGNFIGLDVSGTHAAGNVIGIEIAGNSNILGGASFGLGNVLSGNSSDGIRLDSSATNNLVQRNFVGTNYNGTSAVGNGGNGVTIVGNNNTLGGSTAAAGNTIASNSGDGVLVSVGTGNTIASNSIFANSGGGISLSNGGNNNLTAPNLLTATLTGSTLTVTGSFTAPTASVNYVLEFFANPSGDAEGKIYLGSLTVKPTSTGTQSFTFTTRTTVTGTYPLITATLTDNTGNTSDFSSGITVQ